MKFSKMHGNGNDYIYVDCLEQKIIEPGAFAKRYSDRHFGIGADGVILICPSKKADFAMEMYNADGSEGEMCGNGIRCLGKYVYEHGRTGKTRFTVETKAGIRQLQLYTKPEKTGKETVEKVRVNMGIPEFRAERIPIISEHTRVINEPIRIAGREYCMTGISMGNPHAVIFVKKVKGLDLELLGPALEYHGRFPRRTNVEFVQVVNPDEIQVRVWERGSKETLSCGTGACASVAAGVLNRLTGRKVTVKLAGGELLVEWLEETGEIYLTGPAEHVYDGEI